MQFEGDEQKNRDNIAKHGISFEDAARIFEGPVLSWADARADYAKCGKSVSAGLALLPF